MNKENDTQRISANTDRDEWLEIIMNNYGEKLTKLAFNYLKDWGKAEDVVQDVFITCYKNFDKDEKIVSYKAWIYRITINRCKDILRSTLFKRGLTSSFILTTLQSQGLTPEMKMMKNHEEEILAHSVISLPLKYREVIIFYYYEDLSIVEISEMLQLNLNTVKTRLARAKKLLKKRMRGV